MHNDPITAWLRQAIADTERQLATLRAGLELRQGMSLTAATPGAVAGSTTPASDDDDDGGPPLGHRFSDSANDRHSERLAERLDPPTGKPRPTKPQPQRTKRGGGRSGTALLREITAKRPATWFTTAQLFDLVVAGGWNGEGLKYPKDTVKQAIRYLCNKGELAVQREGRAKLVRFQPPSAEGSRERQPLTNGISRGSPAFAVREVLGERGSQWTTTTVLAVKAGNRCPLLPTTPTKRTKAVRRILEALVAAGEVPIDHDRKRDAWRVEFDR